MESTMTVDLHVCQNCGKPYMAVRYWQKYCTPKCRLANYWAGEIPRIQAKASAKQTPAATDSIDLLLDMELSPKGPSPAQEAEWQRHKALAQEEAEKNEAEDRKRLEAVEKLIEPESNAIQDWYKKTKE